MDDLRGLVIPKGVELEVTWGIRETTGDQVELLPFKTFALCPELDVFKINGEYVTREVFQAKVRELRAAAEVIE